MGGAAVTFWAFADAHPGLVAWLAVLVAWAVVKTGDAIAGAIARRR